MLTIVWVFLMGLALMIAVVLIKAALLTSRQIEPEPMSEIPIDSKLISEHLSKAVRFKTISHQDSEKSDIKEFQSFHIFLKKTFPRVYSELSQEVIAEYSLLFTWNGHEPDLKPVLLMAHLDVVPVAGGTEGDWTQPPFEGRIADGYIWGRGTMDDKNSLMGILEAVEMLLADGYRPKRTIYLAFGHDEEVGGMVGATQIAAQLKSRGIELEYVLDEGGFITDGVVKGVSQPVALVGIAEKGYLSIELVAEGEGGHSSIPPKHTAVGILSTAIHDLERNQFPAAIEGPAKKMLEYLRPEMPFPIKVLLANLWLFGPLVKRNFAANPGTNAGIRSTIAATMFEAGEKENVLPTKARAVINFRIIPGESSESVINHVKNIVKDKRITINTRGAFQSESSAVSDTDSQGFRTLERTIRQVFPETLIAPFLFTGATDSRHYREVCGNILRINPVRMGPDDIKKPHGTNERVSIDNYEEIVKFYVQFIRNSDSME